MGQTPSSRSQGNKIIVHVERSYHREYLCEISKLLHSQVISNVKVSERRTE